MLLTCGSAMRCHQLLRSRHGTEGRFAISAVRPSVCLKRLDSSPMWQGIYAAGDSAGDERVRGLPFGE
jgi:hypothetical protein